MLIALALTFLLPILLLLALPVGMVILLRSWSQTLQWQASFILASAVAFLGYYRIQGILGSPLPIPTYLYWAFETLAVISPICIAVAWSRRIGVKWWLCLALFLAVPIGMIAIWLVNEFPFNS